MSERKIIWKVVIRWKEFEEDDKKQTQNKEVRIKDK